MKFYLVDKVEQLSDDRIVTVKYVSLAEEYLADHFPTFPVLPGVMMLEAVTQSAAWLLHHRTSFARSIAVLREARNVKYGHFVAPGNFLRVEVELGKMTESGATFKASAFVGPATSSGEAASTSSGQAPSGQVQAVQMRIELSCFNLAEKNPDLADVDVRLRDHNRRRWELIRPLEHRPFVLGTQ